MAKATRSGGCRCGIRRNSRLATLPKDVLAAYVARSALLKNAFAAYVARGTVMKHAFAAYVARSARVG